MMRFIQDHFMGAVFVIALMGVLLGIVGIYLTAFMAAIFKMVEIGYTLGG